MLIWEANERYNSGWWFYENDKHVKLGRVMQMHDSKGYEGAIYCYNGSNLGTDFCRSKEQFKTLDEAKAFVEEKHQLHVLSHL